jgi:DNA-binding winged helix-turn-helix (wHTH) protein
MDRSVDVAISRLRKKLLDNATEPYRIKTVRNKGYLFAPTPGKPDDVVIRNRLSVRRLPDAIKTGGSLVSKG